MRNKMFRLLFLVASFLVASPLFAQDNIAAESTMRSNGKIYVVLAICITILAGLFTYVASIDRKIGKIEKENIEA